MLFDFDGTLVDSEYLHHEAWLEAVAPWGVTLGWHAYQRQLVGLSDRRACEFFMDLAGLEPTPARLETGRGSKHRAYRRRAVRELALEPRVREWIRANHRSVPLGVVSSSAVPGIPATVTLRSPKDSLQPGSILNRGSDPATGTNCSLVGMTKGDRC